MIGACSMGFDDHRHFEYLYLKSHHYIQIIIYIFMVKYFIFIYYCLCQLYFFIFLAFLRLFFMMSHLNFPF